MSDFISGQRYISDGEAELGLGTILNCDLRSVTVLFAASEETRTYSVRQAPLTRVAFGSGDRIESSEGWTLTVDDTKEINGLIVYIGETVDGERRELPESAISDHMQFHQARDRLLTGQVDRNDWFNLRYRSLQHRNRIARHPALGLAGPRIGLVPHQLYIADEVSNRRLPRVLLADEVGLGKTIEAGLILHRLLLTKRVSRALILVPDSLTHQWLVELLRRFSLEVTLLDEQQSLARSTERNPFETGQLVLASQQWLFANPHRQEQAQAAQWDMLIVDEAHHLDWTPEGSGPGYSCVEQLAGNANGLLLLTATPEQMGIESHFARLRLLDSERYHDLALFREEEAGYVDVARAIEALERLPDDKHAAQGLTTLLDDSDSRALLTTLLESVDEDELEHARVQLRRQLLDRHGTGRVMFRNSRRHVAGFPERQLHVSTLELPAAYRRVLRKIERDEDYLDELLIETGIDYPDVLLYPEITFEALKTEHDSDAWWRFDPRVEWLRQWLKGHPAEKALIICHAADTARELSAGLQVLTGLHTPVFHEGMTLIERDRAAAAFADSDAEDGSPLLICSEIGSEGRNFQFCHHLIMFDLPAHPDQLEQRIGRLDRIGQQFPIEIHVPVFDQSPGEALLRWYRDGMAAFEAPHGLGSALFDEFGDTLADALLDSDALNNLVADTRTFFVAKREEREAGRNRLLELGSSHPERASAIADGIRELDSDPALPKYFDQALDVFGIDTRELGDDLLYLHPGAHMLDGMPGLVKGEEGFTITFSRETALARDDIQRLSWEHPLVREMLDRVIDGAMGNTALALLKHPSIPGGRLMAEMIFRTQTPAPRGLHLERFLPPTTIRVLLDESGQDLSDKVSFGGLAKNLTNVKKAVARDLIKQRHNQLRQLLDNAERNAEQQLPGIVSTAQAAMRTQLGDELARLEALARHNPAVRDEELDAIRHERDTLDDAIASTRLRLDAVRVIVTVDAEQ
ncbi:RNA polymerase-associated protein RapA [Phytohalomonas tamaricis]|uniref:RNA polymerase-associated protein RapA n=1 Tax=Phytohalomonas tamaricis TaxID=2081032 RepID=UPI000D0ADCAE|nr:RNA polymerase-associated protein RapA [Phytohalomonas tamaricis]